MARAKNDHLMTGRQIADTFGDTEVIQREARLAEIPEEIRLGRMYMYDLDDRDQAALDAWVESLLAESREHTDRIREMKRARSESIGMKVR